MPNAVGAMIGGSVITGALGYKSSKDAAKAQSDAAGAALANDRYVFDKQTELQEPFRQAGLTAQDRTMLLLGLGGDKTSADYGRYSRDFGMDDFEADPGYSFRLSEGLKSLDRQAAARGGLISGSALKASQRYGQEMGSQEYMNAFNRYQTNRSNQLNPLQSLTGSAQTATNTLSSAAGDYGQAAGSRYLDMGNARASGYIGQTNALNNALGGISNAYWMNRAYPK